MARVQTKAEMEAVFEVAEGSLLREGMTPPPFYFAVEKRILDGEIMFEQGKREIISYHAAQARGTVAKSGEDTQV